jgi:hypothetical protein
VFVARANSLGKKLCYGYFATCVITNAIATTIFANVGVFTATKITHVAYFIFTFNFVFFRVVDTHNQKTQTKAFIIIVKMHNKKKLNKI